MSTYEASTAIVTGAASGIGLALSKALIARGAHAWLTDIDGAAAARAAGPLGARAHASVLDVRDAEAVARTVAQVAEERGRLDYMFNNAGIGVGGETHLLDVAHYDRIIDVNIRGVTNGVAAAYPLMVRQGCGHIVNTASAAGLLPAPLLSAYAMTKHAVVGLSNSLRMEGEEFGVRVSALCPGAIETPLLDSDGPEDLPKVWRPDLRGFLTKLGGLPHPSSDLADYTLDAVAANRGLIVVPAMARFAVLLNRIAPGLVLRRIRSALIEALEGRPGG